MGGLTPSLCRKLLRYPRKKVPPSRQNRAASAAICRRFPPVFASAARCAAPSSAPKGRSGRRLACFSRRAPRPPLGFASLQYSGPRSLRSGALRALGGAGPLERRPRPVLACPFGGRRYFMGEGAAAPSRPFPPLSGPPPSRRVPGRPRRVRRGTRERLARPIPGPGFAVGVQGAAVDVRMTHPRFSLGLHPVSLGKTKEMGWNRQHQRKVQQDKTASSSKPQPPGGTGTPPLQWVKRTKNSAAFAAEFLIGLSKITSWPRQPSHRR